MDKSHNKNTNESLICENNNYNFLVSNTTKYNNNLLNDNLKNSNFTHKFNHFNCFQNSNYLSQNVVCSNYTIEKKVCLENRDELLTPNILNDEFCNHKHVSQKQFILDFVFLFLLCF